MRQVTSTSFKSSALASFAAAASNAELLRRSAPDVRATAPLLLLPTSVVGFSSDLAESVAGTAGTVVLVPGAVPLSALAATGTAAAVTAVPVALFADFSSAFVSALLSATAAVVVVVVVVAMLLVAAGTVGL